MKFLITGSSGLIGNSLLEKIKVIPNSEIIELDESHIDSPRAFHNYKFEENIDIIIHLASINRKIKDIDLIMTYNHWFPKEFFKKAVKNGVKKIIVASCSEIYQTSNFKLKESDKTIVSNAYQRSKIMLENFCITLPCEIVILRFSEIYGFDEYCKSFLTDYYFKLKKGENIEINDELHDLLYVDDASEAIVKALGVPSGIYNIGSGKGINKNNIINIIKGEKSDIQENSGKGRILDISLAKEKLGFEVRYDLYKALMEAPFYEPKLKSVLITGGIGDFLAIERFATQEEKQSIETVYYATRAYKEIIEILKAVPQEYPNLKNHIVLWEDFSKIFCFCSKNELGIILRKNKLSSRYWKHVEDWSISKSFIDIINNNYKYNRSSVLYNKLVDINFDLPDKFFVLCPNSSNNPAMIDRNFNKYDWDFAIKHLEKLNLKGVVLDKYKLKVPEHDLLIDLSGKTSILESIEILKIASGYIGIDSCLSVLASRLFYDSIFIKCSNQGVYDASKIYYYPYENPSFLMREFKYFFMPQIFKLV